MGADKREELLRGGDEAIKDLSEALNHNSPPSDGWGAPLVYAHLARWHRLSRECLMNALAGRPPPETESDDELNERWAAEDASLSLEQARERFWTARNAHLAACLSLSEEQWSMFGVRWCSDLFEGHYRSHLDNFLARIQETR